MNKFILSLVFFSCSLFFNACDTASPERCFDVAVLNSNMLVGFAGDGLSRELESPSVKMGKTKDEIIPMQRAEVIDSKIQFVEENLNKIKGLRQTNDTKEIIQASVALHELILPVLRSEYTALAKLYDKGASKEEIGRMDQQIRDTYSTRFEVLYAKLISSGKLYATKHDIQVKWNS